MNYQSALTSLYFLLINSDGNVNAGEIELGYKLMKLEGMSEETFSSQVALLKAANFSVTYNEAIKALKKFDKKLQIKCVAWLCVAANADGFMDRREWQFIYRVYSKELNLPLEEVLKKQKELSREFKTSSESTFVTVL